MPTAPGVPDELLRPALELAVAVAKTGESALPAQPGPRPLKRFLQFTRLPEAALGPVRRVLESDEEFRRRVADVVPDEEVVGRAGWLYLHRPDGWDDELADLAEREAAVGAAAEEARAEASAGRRLAIVEAQLSRLDEDLAAARLEAVSLREQLADERRARRVGDSELGRLRRRVEELEAELAAGAETVAAAHATREESARLAGELERQAAARAEAEARAGRLEARADAPPAPAGPDVDAVAVARAVAAASSAVAALAAALTDAAEQLAPYLPDRPDAAPSPPAAPPGGAARPARRRPADLPPGVFDDTVEAAAHLVRVEGAVVFVDGYNVTKLARPDLALPAQRRWLVDAACGLAARTGAEVHVVFDGAAEAGTAPAELPRRAGVQVRYTPAGTEADDALLELVGATAPGRPAVVASSDRRVQAGARRLGANVISSAQLVEVLRR